MTEFVKCQFCAGHDVVSPEAEAAIAEAITEILRARTIREIPGPVQTELDNIRNAIHNAAERRNAPSTIDPMLE